MDILFLFLDFKMSSNESASKYDNYEEGKENSSSDNSDREIAKILTEVGQSLEELRTRYLQVQQVGGRCLCPRCWRGAESRGNLERTW